MQLVALPQYTSGQLVRSISQSVKKAVCKEEEQQCSCCWHALLCKFQHIEIYMRGRFLLVRDKIGTLYNFCLQKWTYFLLLDKQGIVLSTLIKEVSFFSCYRGPTADWVTQWKSFCSCIFSRIPMLHQSHLTQFLRYKKWLGIFKTIYIYKRGSFIK